MQSKLLTCMPKACTSYLTPSLHRGLNRHKLYPEKSARWKLETPVALAALLYKLYALQVTCDGTYVHGTTI